MATKKLVNLDQILGHEAKILARVESGMADENDLALLRHYESRRRACYGCVHNKKLCLRQIRQYNDGGVI